MIRITALLVCLLVLTSCAPAPIEVTSVSLPANIQAVCNEQPVYLAIDPMTGANLFAVSSGPDYTGTTKYYDPSGSLVGEAQWSDVPQFTLHSGKQASCTFNGDECPKSTSAKNVCKNWAPELIQRDLDRLADNTRTSVSCQAKVNRYSEIEGFIVHSSSMGERDSEGVYKTIGQDMAIRTTDDCIFYVALPLGAEVKLGRFTKVEGFVKEYPNRSPVLYLIDTNHSSK